MIRLKDKKIFVFLLSTSIIGFLLRLYHLDQKSLNNAELSTYGRIGYSFYEMVKRLIISPYPPLYYMLMKPWVRIFGDSEFSLRFPSLIFSVLSIIFIFYLSREIFNKRVGVISALLLSISPYSIYYAQDAKMYPMLWFLCIGSFFFFYRFITGNKIRDLLFYIVFTIMCFYTMYIGLIFMIIQNIFFFTFLNENKQYKKWLIAQFIVILSYLPWVSMVFFIKGGVNDLGIFGFLDKVMGSWIFKVSNYSLFLQRLFLQVTGISWRRPHSNLDYLGMHLCGFLIISAITYFGNIKRRGRIFDFAKSDFLLFLWVIIPIIIYTIIDIFLRPLFRICYLGFIHIPLIILISKGFCKYNLRIKSVILPLMLLVIFSNNLCPYYRQTLKSGKDWRGLIGQLHKKACSNDLVFGNTTRGIEYYYRKKLEIKPLKCFTEGKNTYDKNSSIFVIYSNKKQCKHIKKNVPNGYRVKEDNRFGSVGFLWLDEFP